MLGFNKLNYNDYGTLYCKDGKLFLYNYFRDNDSNQFTVDGDDIYGDGMKIDSGLFPEITWKNSSQKVELKLI